MTVLEEIVAHKRVEVAAAEKAVSVEALRSKPLYNEPRKPLEFKSGEPFVIAEFKRKSPSNPNINLDANIPDVVSRYQRMGASAISVLTDHKYFGGSLEDLVAVRQASAVPVLRKDFVVSEYQIEEAKAYGADIILLIAAALSKAEMQGFHDKAEELGLRVLVELHDESEMDRIPQGASIVGVNSRNLKTLETNKERFYNMVNDLPSNAYKIAESAIQSEEEIAKLMEIGYHGFLIGEALMTEKFKSLHVG